MNVEIRVRSIFIYAIRTNNAAAAIVKGYSLAKMETFGKDEPASNTSIHFLIGSNKA